MSEIYLSTTPQPKGLLDRPQSNALVADLFVFIAGGMHLALGLGWNFYSYGLHFQFSWFIGVIVGALVAATLTTLLPKRVFLFISSTLVIAAAIIFIAAPENLPALSAGRYISGVGTGFVTVPFMVHGSELANPSFRGFCLCFEQFGLAAGVYIQMLYTAGWSVNSGFSATRLLGIFCLIFGVIAFGCTFVASESPVFHLRRGNDAAALDVLVRLQHPQVLTSAKKLWLEQLKAYVHDNEQLSPCESAAQAAMPLLKMLLYRCMLAFLLALPLSEAYLLSAYVAVADSFAWTTILYGLMRVLGTLIAWSLLDTVGRKLVSLIGLLVAAALTIAVGGIFSYTPNVLASGKMAAAVALLVVAQLLGSIYAPSTTVYLAEAFPLQLKPYCIALCVAVQYAIHIVVICTFALSVHNLYVYCVCVGAIMCAGALLFAISVPETRKTTLAEAQERFRHLLHPKLY